LMMLEAAEALLTGRRGGLSSGLQAEAEWLASLGRQERGLLRDHAPLGCRDRGSVRAVAALGTGWATEETGDDAVGAILAAAGNDGVSNRPVAAAGPLRVNLHIGAHGHVSDDPGSLASFETALLEELAARAGRPLSVQPLLAYNDDRIDERPTTEGAAAALRERGHEVAAPVVLRTSSLRDGAGANVAAAALTVSCSYHVALTSLLLGVPAALLADNDYYRQKAAGLSEDFGLPAVFAPTLGDDPAALAVGLHRLAVAEPAAARTRETVGAGAVAVGARRRRTEAAVLGRLEAALDRGRLRRFLARLGSRR
jgi:hypothetical protein